MVKIEVNEEEYKPLWEVLGGFDLVIYIQSKTAFLNVVRDIFPDFDTDIAVA